MRKYIFPLFFSILFSFTNSGFAQKKLLKELDETIKNRQHYMDIKEVRIDSLRKLFSKTSTLQQQYDLNSKIYDEYATYHFDSAMIYIRKNEILAKKLEGSIYDIDTKLSYVTLLSTSGLIKEAIDLLNSVDRNQIDKDYLLKYYEASEWTYQRARIFANDTIFAPIYYQKTKAYADSIYQIAEPGSIKHNSYKGFLLMLENEWDKAEALFLDLYPRIRIDTRDYAIVTYYLALINKNKDDDEKYKEFLIRSAISDQVCALKENASLHMLAINLYQNEPNQIERAYRYLQTSLSDASFFNNRVRAIQIGYNLPVVASAYQIKSKAENKRLRILLITISVLAVSMVVTVIFIYKQMNMIARNRKELLSLNNQLHFLNESLNNANKTKEEYVGLFVDLCSSYIDQINNYRKMVMHKIIANQVDDLLIQAKSSEKTDYILQEFFQSFDKAFLKLYPSFIEDLNVLLNEDSQIILKDKGQLTSELRIFALIRLGISDSAKIAAFLRYSPQTIYNYRTKLRNKAKGNREDFEDRVMMLGI